jgi:N-acetylneuraminate synthase
MVEVHVTMSREAFGPDVPASLMPAELKQLVEGAGFIRAALDHPVDKNQMAEELAPMRSLFTRSLAARVNLAAGTVLGEEHLAVRKPGTGIPANRLQSVVGRRLARPVAANVLLSENDLL